LKSAAKKDMKMSKLIFQIYLIEDFETLKNNSYVQ